MKNKIFKDGGKRLSLADFLGFAWYAFVAFSMVHHGNAVRLSASGASNLDIQLPMYATSVLLVLAVVLRMCYGRWRSVRLLYALVVAGTSVALSFGMAFRFEAQFVLSVGVMNALNLIFAAHAIWRTGRCFDAADGYPKALAWLDGCAGYVAALAIAAQVVELGVECVPFALKSGVALVIVLTAVVVAVAVWTSCFVHNVQMQKVSAALYYAYSVLVVGAFLLVFHYFMYTDVPMHEVVCREYLNFREFSVGGYYPYDDMMVWRALNLLLSSALVVKAFGRK